MNKAELRKIYRRWKAEEIEAIELIEAVARYLGDWHYPAPPSQDLMGIPALTDDQVEAVLHLVESRLCIIWAKVGAREAFAKELRVMEPAPDDEEEICEACGEAFEEGDLVYWSSDDTGHLHADCCGPEREGYVNPDGSPLADGDPIPQPFAYKPPSKTIKRLATATEGSGE